MLSKINKRLGVAAAREEMRIPSETEVADRTMELFYFACTMTMIIVCVVYWTAFTNSSLGFATAILGPLSTLAAGIFSRRKRLRMGDQRASYLSSLAESNCSSD